MSFEGYTFSMTDSPFASAAAVIILCATLFEGGTVTAPESSFGVIFISIYLLQMPLHFV